MKQAKRNPNRRPTRLTLAFAAALAASLLAALPARADIDIEEVTSKGGITAWLVEDRTNPMISIRFAFEGGSTQDPSDKAGMAQLMSGLFDEGAGELEARAFRDELDLAGAEMSFNGGRDAVFGSMRMLSEHHERAFELLGMAVTEPRFDAEPVETVRAQLEARIRSNAQDPRHRAQVAFAEAIYGDHPYARRDDGTVESLEAITPGDLTDFHRRLFARDNLHVAVVGDIDAEELGPLLDSVFGDLPETADLNEVETVEPQLDQTVRIDYDVAQSTLQLAYPGLTRDDPDFYAAYVMNHVLGGGTFSSRLFEEVRRERGLAYSVGSHLVSRQYSSALIIGTATRPDSAEEALELIRSEARRLADEGVSSEELEDARRHILGAYAISNLDSSRAIASTLVNNQLDGLGIDYVTEREDLIGSVTPEDVADAARRLLLAEPAVMIVGPEAEDEEQEQP